MKVSTLTKNYYSKHTTLRVLSNISFSVDNGEILVILGPSGCGKTTLLNILSGLEPYDSGVLDLHTKKQDIGYMFQTDLLLPWRTVFENVLIGAQVQNERTPNLEKEATELIKKQGLGGFETYYPHSLSGGMKQRIAFIRTIITKPFLLLLDEPFSSLDYQQKLELELELFKYVKSTKAKAILVTHDIEEAIALGDRILLLSKRPASIKQELIIKMKSKDPISKREDTMFRTYFKKIWESMQSEKK